MTTGCLDVEPGPRNVRTECRNFGSEYCRSGEGSSAVFCSGSRPDDLVCVGSLWGIGDGTLSS